MLDREEEPFGSQSFVSAYADMRMWLPALGPVFGTAVGLAFGGTGVGLDLAAGALALAAGAAVALGAAEEEVDLALVLVLVVSASPSPPQAIRINSMTATIAGKIFFTLRNRSLDINPPGIPACLFVRSSVLEPRFPVYPVYENHQFGGHANETSNIYYSRLGYASSQAGISQVSAIQRKPG